MLVQQEKNDKTKNVCVYVKENVIGKVMTLELLCPHFFAYIYFTYKRDDLFFILMRLHCHFLWIFFE